MIAVLLMLAALLPSALHAAERDAAAPPASCIEAEVNGYRSLSYDCLNQDMAQRLARQRPPRRGAPAVSEEAPRRPPSALGMPTPATLGNRMGNTFGVSAFPQHP